MQVRGLGAGDVEWSQQGASASRSTPQSPTSFSPKVRREAEGREGAHRGGKLPGTPDSSSPFPLVAGIP